MLDFDHEEFLVTLPIWMVTPKRGGKSWKDSLNKVVKVHAGKSGKEGLYPAVFTDEDQAASLIETLTSRAGRATTDLERFSLETPQDVIYALDTIKDLGETNVAIDPGKVRVRVIPIDRIRSAILGGR